MSLHFEALLQAIAPFQDGIVIGVECMFCWYWLADRCAEHDIPFVVGHVLYMKLIHGAKAKNDRIDANKSARLLKGGNFPLSYPYPKGMRETRATAAPPHVSGPQTGRVDHSSSAPERQPLTRLTSQLPPARS